VFLVGSLLLISLGFCVVFMVGSLLLISYFSVLCLWWDLCCSSL
jgi:hypothetical protein